MSSNSNSTASNSISTQFFVVPEQNFRALAEVLDALELLQDVFLAHDGTDLPSRISSGAYTVLRNLQRDLSEVLESYRYAPAKLCEPLTKGAGDE